MLKCVFQVHYCEELIHRLFENLDNTNLTAIDRMGLLDDQVAMDHCVFRFATRGQCIKGKKARFF